MVPDPFIQFQNITKRFAGVTALDEVSLSIARGEVHALMGENGAGKSTLGKALAGIHIPDSGTILIDGQAQRFRSPREAVAAGVGMVHQELAFCPDLTVAENCCLGQYPRIAGWFVSRAEMNRRADAMLREIGVMMDVRQPMRNLTTGQEQLVQIAAAVGTGARVLVFDEPTSSLSEPESQQLFELIKRLRRQGVTMIYVSHRMPEVFMLCDRLSVLRDGKYVGTLERKDATEERVVQMMIGRAIEHKSINSAPPPANVKPVLRVKNLRSPGKFQDISFDLKPGEILGFAGLVGAGRSEVAVALFGLDPHVEGDVLIDDRPLPLRNVRESMARGIGLVPEDRKRQGLVLMMGGRENFSMAMLDRFRAMGLFVDRFHERRETGEYFNRLRVKIPTLDSPVGGLSGGNQQKVALAKWLGRGARVLIVDEPTRGVDVGAKAAIHDLLRELAAQGTAILVISSELPEVINLSDRIIALREGRIAGEITRRGAAQEEVMRLMAGVRQSA